ncbi:MAG: HNH endonuclease [Alphaproteobacteria bacterium]|nr:HNH endonuclease [Alphaproteobacteria bacterium]
MTTQVTSSPPIAATPPPSVDSLPPLESCPALVLNADYRPLSYFPLSIWSWQDAVKAIFRESVTVIAEYDRAIHSPSTQVKLPSVLVLNEYVSVSSTPAFTRFNVFLRDALHCQYCGDPFKTHQLTFDHVIPRSKGGKTSWDNIVAACRKCNTRKGHKLPEQCSMFPITEPREPTVHELQETGKRFPPNFLHESWADFLYWDSELEGQI